MPSAPFVARNVVVLSDGTGNSAAKLQKTNVWRLYEALDLASGDQVAMYDDGVGTASFKPIAILGGAFGYGLKRNVLDLYTFLCRNHRQDPADPAHADRIFAFGFSRGAYTARVLAAMVARVGLVQADSDAELRRLALWAYRRYRAERFPHVLPVRIGRRLRDLVLGAWDRLRGKPPFDPGRTRRPDIEFLGVWDTVAAYGLPVDELTRGFERWVWPMLPKDRSVSPRIRRACHALALDDERQTFFPLLWTEEDETQNATSTHVHEERVTQVWFAGMHSDVGGGYPDDGLAHTPLVWMAGEASRRGLRFRASLCARAGGLPDAWVDRAVPVAPAHDSRRGLGVYYRYHPRPVERLCRDPHAQVLVRRPKIHESVFERISRGVDGYAPVVLPEHYAVVTGDGRILGDADPADPTSPDANPYEHASQRVVRRTRQEHALNTVWWRRVCYFLTVLATLILLLIPLCPVRDRLTWPAVDSPLLSSVVGLLGAVLPAFAGPWLAHYEARPAQLLLGAVIVGVLVWWSRRLTVATFDRMRAVFRHTGLTARPVPPVSSPTDWIYRLRTHPWYRRAFHLLSYHLVPNVFGLLILALLAIVLPVRLVSEVASRARVLTPSTCGGPAARLGGDPAGVVALFPDLLCNATNLRLQKGQVYRVDVALPGADSCGAVDGGARPRLGPWRDATVRVADARGFSSLAADAPGWIRAAYVVGVPFRRVVSAPWMTPVVEIGVATPSRIPTAGGTFVADREGEASMYVNDAIVPLPSFASRYRNNGGGPARVRIVPGSAAVGPLAPYTCDEQRALAGGRPR